MNALIALLPVFVVLVAFFMYVYYRRWRDRRIRSKPFPSAWLAILEASLPVYRSLSQPEQSRLRQLMQLFLAGKRFYGCAGLTILRLIVLY